MRGLIERADETKMQRAGLAAVLTAAKATEPEPETTSETSAETEPEEV